MKSPVHQTGVLKRIAEEAGCSPSTVSRVLNGPQGSGGAHPRHCRCFPLSAEPVSADHAGEGFQTHRDF